MGGRFASTRLVEWKGRDGRLVMDWFARVNPLRLLRWYQVVIASGTSAAGLSLCHFPVDSFVVVCISLAHAIPDVHSRYRRSRGREDVKRRSHMQSRGQVRVISKIQ